MADVVLIEFCGSPLAFTREQIEEARSRARDVLPAAESPAAAPAELMVDAARLAEITGLPATWIEEQARRSRLPSLQLGKYRRFQVDEAMAALRKLGRTP